MTTSRTPSLTLTVETGPSAVVVRVDGDLDYESYDELVNAVGRRLAEWPAGEGTGRPELHLNFGRLGDVDSMGLSALLMIRRLTDTAGVGLRLDERPPTLQRLLEVTGTLEHLTAPREQGRTGEGPGAG
jgi:anti-anti-sigma factor